MGIQRRRRERAMQARIAGLEAWWRYDHPVRIHYPLPPMPVARVRQPSRHTGALVVVAVFLVAFVVAGIINAVGH